MRNLVSNAIKFTPPEGSITIRMRIVASNLVTSVRRPSRSHLQSNEGLHMVTRISAEEPMWLQIDVIDTGHGISEENLPKLFHQIIQFDAGKLQGGGGSGIGLWGKLYVSIEFAY